MKVGKPKSKRVPVRLRHKIQKASASKQRKERKEAKKNPQWKSRLKKDPGIPNLFPYKDKILAEIEDGRRKKEEEALRRREVARAQRGGGAAVVADSKNAKQGVDREEDEEILDDAEDLDEDQDDEEMDVESNANPMAALLASAQARAQAYTQVSDEEDEEEEEDDETAGVPLPKSTSKPSKKTSSSNPSAPTRRLLPAAALADPIKTVSKLLARLENTPQQIGLQQLLDYYAIDPLPPASKEIDSTARFLVDVARKRGRLGRGGVPNLQAAAFTVLGDLNEERLRLPALEQQQQGAEVVKTTTKVAKGKGVVERSEVQIVQSMAEPFRIEGLFGDD
jgi:nuclear GTP-binding protein